MSDLKMPDIVWLSRDEIHNEPCEMFSGLNYAHHTHAHTKYVRYVVMDDLISACGGLSERYTRGMAVGAALNKMKGEVLKLKDIIDD